MFSIGLSLTRLFISTAYPLPTFFFPAGRRRHRRSSSSRASLLHTNSSNNSLILLFLLLCTTLPRRRRRPRPLPSDSAWPLESAASLWAWTEAAVAVVLEVRLREEEKNSSFFSTRSSHSLFLLLLLSSKTNQRQRTLAARGGSENSLVCKLCSSSLFAKLTFFSCSLSLSLLSLARSLAFTAQNFAHPRPKIRGPIHGPPPVPFESACSLEAIGGGEGANRRLEKSNVEKQLAQKKGRPPGVVFLLASKKHTARKQHRPLVKYPKSSRILLCLHSIESLKHVKRNDADEKRKKVAQGDGNGTWKVLLSCFRDSFCSFAPFHHANSIFSSFFSATTAVI